jgi:hypothetical protein
MDLATIRCDRMMKFKNKGEGGQVWWYVPIIPATPEIEIRGSQQDQPRQKVSETLTNSKNKPGKVVYTGGASY